MVILTLRTDKPDAEIGLYENEHQLYYEIWPAHRQLAETIHAKLRASLDSLTKQLSDLEGVVVFQGPGSFTGLRIGITVANALAYSLAIPIVTAQESTWIDIGITKLLAGINDIPVLPEYGALPNITVQRR